MSVYAESSAVLRWLLNEPDPDGAVQELHDASRIVTSELTLLECRRALVRLEAAGTLDAGLALQRRQQFDRTVLGWDLWPVDLVVLNRAAEAWPREPVRSLDAIHLSTALQARAAVPDLQVLSLDHRVRENAGALGLPLLPT